MIGTSIGTYRITAKLGAGGMGEVYRATDTKLKRDVALKVLPEAFARDPERLTRFEREAEVLASLNHPNIATIYGVVEDRALVMELVEGSEPKGPLPFDEAWAIMSQVAAALEYAHEKGVVHRDLKPANIKVTPDGQAKLLDFGLAKAFSGQADAQANPENSPTLTIGATQIGVILGTAAYMSPEQAKGKSVDKRADIWAFGVVLYELLRGERLFKGEDVSETLAQVLTKEPDLNKLPAKVRRLLGRCLERDPKKRLRDIGEAGYLVDTASANASSKDSAWWWKCVAGMLAVALSMMLYLMWPKAADLKPLMRLSVDLGPDALLGTNTTVAISPDGTRIVFPIRGMGGKQMLATRLLDQPSATPLNGTEDGIDPFFSPDGQWIGFFAGNKLKKISGFGGAAVTLCDVSNSRGGSWGEDGYIIASLNTRSGLVRIPAAGGLPQPLTQLKAGEITHRWPQVLPGNNAVVFTHSPVLARYDDAAIEAVSLRTGERKTLWRGGYFGRYVPAKGSSGYLTYIHQGTLFAMAFDPRRLEVRGTPVPLLEDVAAYPLNGGGQVDVSRTGTLVYVRGQGTGTGYSVAWLDSAGKTSPLLSKPGTYLTPRVSPDGQRLTLGLGGPAGYDIWVYDASRDSMTRLSFTPGDNRWPVWAPDGKHIVFRSLASAMASIDWIRADGAGDVQKLVESKSDITPFSFSPDGKRLAYYESNKADSDIWTLPLDLTDPEHPKAGKPELFFHTPFNEQYPAFSPDGRWVAYSSDESRVNEIYVRSFSGQGGKWQISAGGGVYPMWSRDGRELFYESPDNRIMVTDYVANGDSFRAGKPRTWSNQMQVLYTTGSLNMDLAPDGKRFAVLPRAENADLANGSVHVTFLLNFFDELRRRVPVSK